MTTVIQMLMIVVLASSQLQAVRAASSNNALKSVTFDIGSLNYEFTPSRIYYNLTIPSNVDKVDVKVVPEDASAKYTIAGHNTIQNESSTGKIVVTVVAANGDKKWYTFAIQFGTPTTTTKATTTSATIKSYLLDVSFDIGELSEPFSSTIKEYTLVVPKTTKEIKVNPTTADNEATLVEGNKDIDLTKASAITIAVKDTKYVFHLSTESATSTPTDTTNSAQFGLELLEIKNYKLNKTFALNTYEYSIVVEQGATAFEINAIASDPEAMIEVDQNAIRIKIVVSSDEKRATYVVKLQEKGSVNNTSLQPVLFDLLISMVLLTLAVVLFFLSRKANVGSE